MVYCVCECNTTETEGSQMANSLTITANMTQKINYAFVQNYMPVVRNVLLKNNTEQTLNDLVLKISFLSTPLEIIVGKQCHYRRK